MIRGLILPIVDYDGSDMQWLTIGEIIERNENDTLTDRQREYLGETIDYFVTDSTVSTRLLK